MFILRELRLPPGIEMRTITFALIELAILLCALTESYDSVKAQSNTFKSISAKVIVCTFTITLYHNWIVYDCEVEFKVNMIASCHKWFVCAYFPLCLELNVI